MKKLCTVLFCLFVFVSAYGQAPVSYDLPLDLSSNQVVDPVSEAPDVTSATTYSDMTAMIAKLQGQLGEQTDNLSKNKNLLQIYNPFGAQLEKTAYYTDKDKLAVLITAYNTAMKTVKSNLIISQKNIDKINAGIEKINRVINNRMNIEQSQQTFRQWVSFIFAGLLAIIIGCFFFVLFKNNSTQTASILMGESGLQFITLFSLIISIILFGVLNILEGKELAAIISAIAGFILGKYNPTKDNGKQPNPNPDPNPNPAPNPNSNPQNPNPTPNPDTIPPNE